MTLTKNRILMASDAKPQASLSLDLDNLWSYMKTHGDEGWQSFPSYFDRTIPGILDLLEEQHLQITFFVVGQDAAIDGNRPFLKMISQKGHEFGNHTFNHDVWLHRFSKGKIRWEISETEKYLESISGRKPIGFRGPGFSWSPALFEVLVDMGYSYDASTLPTYLGPLARMYYFQSANLSPKERADRKKLFGRLADGRRPCRPYTWQLTGNRSLLEIPVTTMPLFKTPFHLSYLLFLSKYSMLLMRVYLGMAIALCRMTHTSPSFLLHPLDLIGGDQVPELLFFPGMDVDSHQKVRVFRAVMAVLTKHFDIIDMSCHVQQLKNQFLRNIPAIK